jgi:hypothetical protein
VTTTFSVERDHGCALLVLVLVAGTAASILGLHIKPRGNAS